MIEGALADRRIGIAHRSVLVFLVLKDVGIDRAGLHAVFLGQALHLGNILQPVGKVPLHMQRHGRASAGQGMHLPGVAELVFDRDCGRELNEFAETGPGVGKAPGGQLDIKIVESTMN